MPNPSDAPEIDPRHGYKNWNEQSHLHHFGALLGKRTIVALCGITVRRIDGFWASDREDVCPICVDFVNRHLTFEQAREERRVALTVRKPAP